ncbi:MAG: cellulose biosynthesis cyclic di-GMP-binding regulatory protein BcsB [Steroidobacterales bacterium]
MLTSHAKGSWSALARAACISALLLLVTDAAMAATAGPATPAPAPNDARIVRWTFRDLGVAAPIDMRGTEAGTDIPVGIRADEVVTAARLRLHVTHSPALLPDLSHLRIRLNGQTLAALPLLRTEAGHEVIHEVVLDPNYFTGYNHLHLDLIGHYTLECEDPQHSSVWATISDLSELELELRPLELRNDLALLPAPFLDRHDNHKLVLPVVLPQSPSRAIARSAGIIASWFGVQADYRSARFPVSLNELPAANALVFATNDHQPAGLNLPPVNAPTLSMIDHPAGRHLKLLVFMGRDEAELQKAVEGFVSGQAVLTGASVTLANISLTRRAAYDAPRWLTTDRLVRFGELIDDPRDLEAFGHVPAPLRLRVHMPPDLLIWNQPGVPIDLRYRFTPPPENDASSLTVSINGELVRVFRLRPNEGPGGLGHLVIPTILSSARQDAESFLLPAFRIGGDNTVDFQFALDMHYQGACRVMPRDTVRESIDPDSTLDLRAFHHYAALPDLTLFANAGFPFSRYADLAETAFVLPEPMTAAGLEQLYFVLGRIGRQTGITASHFHLLDTTEALKAQDMDLIVLGGAASNKLLSDWRKDASLVLGESDRRFTDFGPVPQFVVDPLRFDAKPTAESEVTVSGRGSIGALLGFESPITSGRSVVALIGSDAAGVAAVTDALDDSARVASIHGDLVLVRAGELRSYESGQVYYVGTLSWWTRVWFHLSHHPLLLTFAALAIALTIAVWVFSLLQRRAARRLDGQAR